MATIALIETDDEITTGVGDVVTVSASVDTGVRPVFYSPDTGRRLAADPDDLGVWTATWATSASGDYAIRVEAAQAPPVIVVVTVTGDGPPAPDYYGTPLLDQAYDARDVAVAARNTTLGYRNAAQNARDAAVAARVGAETAQTLATLIAMGDVDATLAAAVGDTDTLAGAALADEFAPVGHVDYTGDDPLVEWAVLGDGSALHLLAGEGNQAAYVLGIGVDHDRADNTGSVGLTMSVKSAKGTGYGLNLENTSGPDAKGFLAGNFGDGTLMELRKASLGKVLHLRNYGYGGTLFSWALTDNGDTGYVDQQGGLNVQQDNGTPSHRTRIGAPGNGQNMGMFHYAGVVGGEDVWFPSSIATNANFTELKAGAFAPIGEEVLSTIFKWGNGNQWGFFGEAREQQNVTGSRGGNAALASLLTILDSHGVIVDATTA